MNYMYRDYIVIIVDRGVQGQARPDMHFLMYGLFQLVDML